MTTNALSLRLVNILIYKKKRKNLKDQPCWLFFVISNDNLEFGHKQNYQVGHVCLS